MKKILLLILSLSQFIVAGCATTEANNQVITFPPPNDDFYRDMFESGVHRLGLFRSKGSYGDHTQIDQILVTINASFDGQLGISLTHDVSLTEVDPFEGYILQVAVWEYSDNERLETGDIVIQTSELKSYWTEAIPNTDFDRVANRLKTSGFFREKFTDKPPSFCTDGTIYFIEGRVDDEHNLIGRHTCDNGFRSKIQMVDALFDLAIDKFPMIATRLQKMRLAIMP